MNRKTLLKLIVCDAALALLTLEYSLLCPFGKQWIEPYSMSYAGMLLYQLIYGQMAAPVALVVLTFAFTWATFRVSGACKRWQLVMTMNALVCMAAGPGVFAVIFAVGNIAPIYSLAFSRMMFWTSLLAIALGFPLRRLKRKGLAG